jgi:hypothetical protein
LLKLFVFSKMFDFLNFTLKSTNIIFLLIYIYIRSSFFYVTIFLEPFVNFF